MKYVLLMLALVTLNACATSGRYKPDTGSICSHPAVQGGAPFQLGDKVTVEGDVVYTIGDDGSEAALTGAQCLLIKRLPASDETQPPSEERLK